MRRLSFALFLGVIAAPLAAQAPSRTTTLTLDEALSIAKKNNPIYMETVNRQRSAGLGVRSAYGGLFPTATSSFGVGWREGKQTFIEGQAFGAAADVLSSNYSIGFSLNYSLQSILAPRQANAQLTAAEATTESQVQQLRQAVTGAYFNAVQAVRAAELGDTLLASQRLQLQLAQARERLGSGTPLETKNAEVRLAQQELQALSGHNSADIAKVQLFAQLGVPWQGDVTLTTDLPVTQPSFKLEDLIGDARSHNGGLQAARATQLSAEIGRRQATGAYVPSFGLSTGIGGQTSMLTNAKGDQRTWPFNFDRSPKSVSVGLSLPLWDGFRREQNTENATLNLNSAREEVRRTDLNLVATVTADLLQVQFDYQAVDLQTRASAAARQALELAQERYRVGSATYLELSNAQDTYQTAENGRLNAIYAYHRDFAALEAAVGRPLR